MLPSRVIWNCSLLVWSSSCMATTFNSVMEILTRTGIKESPSIFAEEIGDTRFWYPFPRMTSLQPISSDLSLQLINWLHLFTIFTHWPSSQVNSSSLHPVSFISILYGDWPLEHSWLSPLNVQMCFPSAYDFWLALVTAIASEYGSCKIHPPSVELCLICEDSIPTMTISAGSVGSCRSVYLSSKNESGH